MKKKAISGVNLHAHSDQATTRRAASTTRKMTAASVAAISGRPFGGDN
jgi:hypothetical protein